MGALSIRVQNLQREVREHLEREFTQADIDRLQNRIASAVLIALGDDEHPLARKLAELKAAIKEQPHNIAKEDAKNAEADELKNLTEKQKQTRKKNRIERAKIDHTQLFFMPQPGLFNSAWKQFWPLQLLLHTSSFSRFNGGRLAAHLELSVDSMVEAARVATELSVRRWTKPQHLQYIIEAIGELESPDAPIKLIGRLLQHGLFSVRLSQQQENLVRRLTVVPGAWVSHTELRKAGVGNPVQATAKLRTKLNEEGIPLRIYSQAGSYSLPGDQLESTS